LPYTPLAGPLGLVPLPGAVRVTLALLTGGYVLVTEIAKRIYREPG